MISKISEKQKAIKLRNDGLSYSEILKIVPVAKSTLSLWLRSVGLSKSQKQRLTKKKLDAALRGGEVRKNERILLSEKIKNEAEKEIDKISQRELWLIGISLYWAEGSKEKEHNVSRGVIFSNSDAMMIKIFLKWLRDVLKINDSEIKFEIYIHNDSKNKLDEVVKYWSKIVNSPIKKFQYIYLKNNKINTKRKNIGENYFGLLRVVVKRSTNLNRKIQGWIIGVYKYCGIV